MVIFNTESSSTTQNIRNPSLNNLEEKNNVILLVDDNKSILELNSTLLSLLNYESRCFQDPKKALEYFESTRDQVDIIITDYHMETMNGIEFTRKIRKFNDTIPVLLCSGNVNDEEINDFYKNVGVSVLNKPFSLDELNNKLKTIK